VTQPALECGVLCGDCRDLASVQRLLGGRKANLVITSPPYADRRTYDQSSGFQPISPEQYVAWFKDVQAVIAEVLAPDGSFVLNIKPHAEDGQRVLYVNDLVAAHVRQWGWRFVDEFCWRKTDDGVPGGWPNRFKNAWEPCYHFSRSDRIKFHPEAVGHWSEDCFDYSPLNPKSTSGSGLLGSGARGAAADRGAASYKGKLQGGSEQSSHSKNVGNEGRHAGVTRPSNVLEIKSESRQGSHAAPFPVALAEFFINAFTDKTDVVLDVFGGSGTTAIAALRNGRHGYCCEISPAYTDVIVRRVQEWSARQFYLDGWHQTFEQVLSGRRLEAEDAIKESCEELLAQRGK